MSKSTKASTNKAFIEAQKIAICKYINRFDKINMCDCPQIIVRGANYFFVLKFVQLVTND